MIRCIAIVAILTVPMIGFAQMTSSESKNLELANAFKESGQYNYALSYYSKLKDSSSSCEVIRNKAECYKSLRSTTDAAGLYKQLIKSCPTKKDDLSTYGKLLMQLEKYESAKKLFYSCYKLYDQDSVLKLYMRSCDSALIWNDHIPEKAAVNLENVNSEFEEVSPIRVGNQILFASTREETIIRRKSPRNNQPYYNIWWSEEKKSGELKYPKPFVNGINSTNHEMTINVSDDGAEYYFSRLERKSSNSSGFNRIKIFRTIKRNEDWSKPDKFIYNNDSCSNTQPCISSNGRMLFFASDNLGGYGGMDLYVCKRKGKHWGKPENLGPEVNTPFDEIYPHYIGDSVLFFSSEGHPGMGGFDIFKCKKSNGKWSSVKNMRAPMNSSANDLSLYFDRKTGDYYLSSDRKGGKGGLDLYVIRKH